MNTVALLNRNYRSYALLNDLHQSFKDVCKQENIMILDKTKELLAEFIDEINAPFIYEKVGNRYDHYMIDEFQDTSIREWCNLRPLLIEALSSNVDASVFIVGDIKQSIYRWRGGDWRLLNHDILEDLKLHNPTVEPLAINRRSLENIVKFNNQFILKIVNKDNEYINNLINQESGKGISAATCCELENIIARAYTKSEQDVHLTGSQGIAEVTLYDPKVTPPPFIEAIEDAISRGYSYKDILILVRGATDGSKVVNTLYEYKDWLIKNNKPGFNILTSDSLTIDSCDVVKFIIATMRLAIDPHNDIERGIYNGYLQRQYDGSAVVNDTTRINRLMNSFTFTPSYNTSTTNFNHGVSLSANYSENKDLNKFNEGKSDVTTVAIGANYSMTVIPIETNFGFNYSHQNSDGYDSKYVTNVYSLSASKSLLKNRNLALSASMSLVQNKMNTDSNLSFGGSLSAGYTLADVHNFSLSANYNKFSSTNLVADEYKREGGYDFSCSLSYAYSFTAFSIKRNKGNTGGKKYELYSDFSRTARRERALKAYQENANKENRSKANSVGVSGL
jgi:hypothetical protein